MKDVGYRQTGRHRWIAGPGLQTTAYYRLGCKIKHRPFGWMARFAAWRMQRKLDRMREDDKRYNGRDW